MANPTLAQFNKCRKSELHEIAEHYGVPVIASGLPVSGAVPGAVKSFFASL